MLTRPLAKKFSTTNIFRRFSTSNPTREISEWVDKFPKYLGRIGIISGGLYGGSVGFNVGVERWGEDKCGLLFCHREATMSARLLSISGAIIGIPLGRGIGFFAGKLAVKTGVAQCAAQCTAKVFTRTINTLEKW